MDWEMLCQQAEEAERTGDQALRAKLERRARTILSNQKLEDVAWLEAALKDNQRKWFVTWALRGNKQMPERLFTPMMRAAISQPDASSPKWFVMPLLRCFGPRRVNSALLQLLEEGTDVERIGAANALYFAMGMVEHMGWPDEEMEDLRERRRCVTLQLFVARENVHLRRCLLAQLGLDGSFYPPDLQPLVPEAIRIARSHPDDYIRHRVEVQLGARVSLQPLPGRLQLEEPS